MKKRAFTLIELAISLTVIGLVIGGSFQAIKAMRERAKVTEAKEQVNTAKDAIIGFSMEMIDLPTNVEFNANLSPAKGVSSQQDGMFFYFADPLLNNDIDICSFNSTNLTVAIYDASGALDHSIRDVAFVVAAESANQNIQTNVDSLTAPHTVNVYSPSATQDDNGNDFIRAIDEYDDIVKWVTLFELQQNVNCSDKPFRFINDRLPHADYNASYSATLYVENNISHANISCIPSSSHGITFTDPAFLGTPNPAGTALFDCNATETLPSTRTIAKKFLITIDP